MDYEIVMRPDEVVFRYTETGVEIDAFPIVIDTVDGNPFVSLRGYYLMAVLASQGDTLAGIEGFRGVKV